MNKKSSTPPPRPPTPNAENSVKSKKVRKLKPVTPSMKSRNAVGGGEVGKSEKVPRKASASKKLPNKDFKKDPADDSVRKTRKSIGQQKKKKEVDSYEESRKKNTKTKKKKLKLAEAKKMLKDEEESDRKKEDHSSRKEARGGPLQHATPKPRQSSKRIDPANPEKRNNSDQKNVSDKQRKASDRQRVSDRKTPAPDKQKLSASHPASAPGTPPGASPPPPPAADESGEEDDESSANKTPPDTPEPNEAISDLGSDMIPVNEKASEFVHKGATFAVGSLKLESLETLTGAYGVGLVTVKEVEKKTEHNSPGTLLAVKFEKTGTKMRRLFVEIEIIKNSTLRCLPLFIDSGEHAGFQCLVIDGLGPSVGELHQKLNGFSPLTSCRIALFTLDILRQFHSLLYVHRDIRPQSFFLGKDAATRNKIVLGQMGFAKKFGIKKEVEPEEKCDLEMRKPKYKTKYWKPRKKVKFLGVMKYASRASHLNKEHTRRDDMESWFFMIYEFFNKSLPWKSLSDKDKILESKTNFIMDFKFSDDISKKYGTEFTTICEYFGVQNFHEMEPDYDYFESAILDLLRSANKGGNDKLDWETTPGVFERATTQTEEGKKNAKAT